MSCTASVDNPESAAHSISVPVDFNISPLLPNARAAGFPEESPYMILPLANPAIFANVTALSAIWLVSIALLVIFKVTAALSAPLLATVI